jgi:hypothetical protein
VTLRRLLSSRRFLTLPHLFTLLRHLLSLLRHLLSLLRHLLTGANQDESGFGCMSRSTLLSS